MAILILLAAAAWAWIIPADFRTYFNRFLFDGTGGLIVVATFIHDLTITSTRSYQFVLPYFHLTHVCLLFPSLPDGALCLFRRNTAVTKETYNILVHFTIHSAEKFECFHLINDKRILLFQVSSLNTLF